MGATVAELAGRLGYRSAAVFAPAFKREIGVSPGALKRSGARRGEAARPEGVARAVG